MNKRVADLGNEVPQYEIHNHTPHEVRLVGGAEDIRIPARAPTPRVQQLFSEVSTVVFDNMSMSLRRTSFGNDVANLPPPRRGRLLLVSRLVATACSDRADLVFPEDLVRDQRGAVIGCRALGTVAEEAVLRAAFP